MRKTRLTCTGNTFKNQKLAGRHTCDKSADNFRCIVQMQLSGSKHTISFHKFLQCDILIKFRILIILIFNIHKSKFRESLCRVVVFFVSAAGGHAAGLDRHLRCGNHCTGRYSSYTLIAADIANCRNRIIRQCGGTHIRNTLCSTHRIDLQGKYFIFLVNETDHLFVQSSDFFIQRGIIFLVCLQLSVKLPPSHKNNENQYRNRYQKYHKQNCQYLCTDIQKFKICPKNCKIFNPPCKTQFDDCRKNRRQIVHNL